MLLENVLADVTIGEIEATDLFGRLKKLMNRLNNGHKAVRNKWNGGNR